jgi:hypothetical protein
MIEQFRSARRAHAPIVAITTPDPTSTIRDIRTVFPTFPAVQWNIVDGVTSMNEKAKPAVTQMHTIDAQLMPASMINSNPVDALRLCHQWLTPESIMFFHNAHFYVEQGPSDSHKPCIQAVWNLRDPWKDSQRTLVLLAPSIQMPIELRNDTAIIDEALHTDKDMATIEERGL